MKQSHYIFAFILNVFFVFNCLAGGLEPIGVESADLPDNGWYWAGASNGVSGWGLNIETQDANFSSTGTFMFGSVYTYDENGAPVWYTFSGEYNPNNDVYAWRDGNGVMGTLTSPLYKTSGGGCLTCVQSEPVSTQEVYTVTITWANPLDATISLSSGASHDVSRMIWHSGIGAQDIDFITKGSFMLYWQDVNKEVSTNKILHTGYRGLVHFNKVVNPSEQLMQNSFYNENNLYYTSSADDNIFYKFSEFFGDSNNAITLEVILEYDINTRQVSLFGFSSSNDIIINGCSFATRGYLRPSSSHESVLYGVNDQRCTSHVIDDSLRHVVFATLSRVTNSSQAINNNSFLDLEPEF